MPTIYIIRGVPGSGKTTMAETLVKQGKASIHVEADMFMINADGDYEFDPKKLTFCHDQCQNVVNAAMQLNRDIVVSNTFTRKWEMKPYVDMAEEFGYRVCEIIMRGDFENIHGVPCDKVSAMKERFEY